MPSMDTISMEIQSVILSAEMDSPSLTSSLIEMNERAHLIFQLNSEKSSVKEKAEEHRIKFKAGEMNENE